MSIAIRVYLVNRTEYTIMRVDMYDIDETDSKTIKLLEEDAWQTMTTPGAILTGTEEFSIWLKRSFL